MLTQLIPECSNTAAVSLLNGIMSETVERARIAAANADQARANHARRLLASLQATNAR